MKIQQRNFTKVTAVVVLALLLGIAALPAFTASGSCSGSDDYGLCVASAGSSGGIGVPHPDAGPGWLPQMSHCDNDPATSVPSCDDTGG